MDKNCLELEQTSLTSEETRHVSNISKEVENVEGKQELCMSFISSADNSNEGISLLLLENHKNVFSSNKDELNTRTCDLNTFRNCPWNLNSSIHVNSVAERQAQKRKIRNGQLPIPKLVNRNPSTSSISKPLNICLDKTNNQESELPDTVQIHTSGIVSVCESKRCSQVVDKMVISDQNLSIEPSSLLSLPDTIDVKLLRGSAHSEELNEETNYLSRIILPSENELFNAASIERLDGLVLNLNYFNCLPQILTVIQEKRITYFENTPRNENGDKPIKWCKSASIPVLIEHLEWISGLRTVEWHSVALQIDTHQYKTTVYAYRSSNLTLSRSFSLGLEDCRDIENLNMSLVSSNEVVIWFNWKGKRGTELMKYLLKNDLTGFTKVNDLKGTDSCIKSLHQVNVNKTVIVGIDDESRIYVWDHEFGILIKSIQMQINNLSSSCIDLIEDRGYLFFLLSQKLGYLNLMALNAYSEKWVNLRIYSADVEGRHKFVIPKGCYFHSFSDCARNNGHLIASHKQGIIVWDLHLGTELASIVALNTNQIYISSNKIFFVTVNNEIYSVDNSQILNL